MLSIRTQRFQYRTDKEWVAQLVGIPLILLILTAASAVLGITMTVLAVTALVTLLGIPLMMLRDAAGGVAQRVRTRFRR